MRFLVLKVKEEYELDEHNIQVSIVMPVYNVSQYLRQCLDSLFAQTLEK